MNKTILIILGVLCVLVVLFILRPDPYRELEPTRTQGLSTFLEIPFDKVQKIALAKGSSDPVILEKEGDGWIVSTAWGYKADEEVVENLLESLEKLDSGEVKGQSKESHKDFQVDDVRGGIITLSGAGDQVLGRVVVGKTAQSRDFNTTKVYVRFGDEDVTYAVESKLRSDAKLYSKIENKNYLAKELFKLGSDEEVVEVRISRPGEPDVIVERRYEEVPVEEKDAAKETAATGEGDETGEASGEEESNPKTERKEYFVVVSGTERHRVDSAKEWAAKGLLRKADSLRFDDVAEPKELAAYGLDAPQLRAACKYRKKSDPDAEIREVTVLFGHAIKDEKGEDKDYHFTLLGDEHKDRVYITQKWTFEGWDKKLADFLPDPPKEEPKDGATDAATDAEASPPEEAPGGAAEDGGATPASGDAGSEPQAASGTEAAPGPGSLPAEPVKSADPPAPAPEGGGEGTAPTGEDGAGTARP